VFTRVAVGRARVVREVRAAGPLTTRLRAPATARGPWLTAVLNEGAARLPRARPVAVVVEAHAHGRPEAVAFLAVRLRGLVTAVELLGSGVEPLPGGRPPARLPAGDADVAALLAEGVLGFIESLHGPWSMRLAGLPLGDPTVRALASRLPTSVVGNERSARLVDGLDEVGDVQRSSDPAFLERWLPPLLAAADPRSRRFLRAAARLHAAIGQLEVAVVASGDDVTAGLLTLLDGGDRWPWWGMTSIGGLSTEMGAPLVTLSVPAGRWPR
jgi:hypothetical protein